MGLLGAIGGAFKGLHNATVGTAKALTPGVGGAKQSFQAAGQQLGGSAKGLHQATKSIGKRSFGRR